MSLQPAPNWVTVGSDMHGINALENFSTQLADNTFVIVI